MNKGKLGHKDYNVISKGQLPEVRMFENLAEVARKRGEKEIQLADGNIRNEYKKRLNETKVMKERIQQHLVSIQAELRAAEKVRVDLLQQLADFQRPFELSMNWAEVRARRPTSPTHSANIDRALQQNNHDLKNCVATLAKTLTELDKVLQDVRAAEARWVKDIDDKTATMILDQACMDEVIKAPQGMHTAGPMPRALMKSSGLHTENEWNNNTNVSLSQGVSTIEACQAIRKKAVAVIKSYAESGRLNRPPIVIDALQQSIKYNSHAKTNLETNARMVTGELTMLEKQRAMLIGSLEKVQQQLNTAQQRLELRVVRPPNEAIRDKVEEVLEIEVINMRNTQASLRKQLGEHDSKRARLVSLLAKLHAEIKDKSANLDLDNKCVTLKMPPLPPLSPRYQHAHPSSPRVQQLSAAAGKASSSPRIQRQPSTSPRNTPRRTTPRANR